MPRTFPAIDRLGEEPIMIVTFPFGSYADREVTVGSAIVPGLINSVGNLDAVTTVGGSGASTSITVSIHDPSGHIKGLMETQNLRFMDVTVTQDWDDAALTSVELFQGQINNVAWNSSTLEVAFTIVSKIESEEVGFSIEDVEVVTGDVGVGDNPSFASDTIGRPPSELIGKAWPLCFGRVIQSPTLRFRWVRDAGDASNDDDGDEGKSEGARIVNIDGEDRWMPVDGASVREFIKAIRAIGSMTPGDDVILSRVLSVKDPLGKWIHQPPGNSVNGTRKGTVSGILQNVRAWDAFYKINIEFQRFRQGAAALKNEILELAFEENGHRDKFNFDTTSLERKGLFENGIRTEQEFVDDLMPRKAEDAGQDLVDAAWNDKPVVKLAKGHGLRNPKKLGAADPLLNTMEVNINGQRFASQIIGSEDLLNHRPNDLRLTDALPVCSGIPFFEREFQYASRVKITANVKIDKQYGIVTSNGAFTGEQISMVVYFTDQEVVTTEQPDNWDDEADGAYQPTYLYSWVGYQPLAVFVYSLDDIRDRVTVPDGKPWLQEDRSYFAFTDLMENGTIVETSFIIRPDWFGRVPDNDVEVLDKVTWQFDKDAAELIHPQIFPPDQLSPYGRLPKTSFQIQAGDTVVPWDGCPKALEDGTDDDSTDSDTDDGKPYIHIANLIPGSMIHAAYALRKIPGKNKPLPVQIPSRYFTWGDETILGKTVTVLKVNKPLSSIDSSWSDDIYVVQTSPVGPNTADIIEWLIGEYGPDLTVNAASFATCAALIDDYPSDFCILDRPNLLAVCKEIAFQARCALWLKGSEVFIKYLGIEPTLGEAIDIDTSLITEGSFNINTTDITDLVTVFKGEWHPTYLDLDKEGNEIQRFYIAKNNVNLYGRHEQEYNFFIYNQETLVRKAMEFWIIRWSNTWQTVSFEAHIPALAAESLDAVELILPAGLLGPTTVKGMAEEVIYDSNNLSAQFKVLTPIRLGETTQYPYAWTQ